MGRKAFVREKILEAAFDLFAREGYEAVATRTIASAAHVGPASMFKHFPTKEDLGRELYRVALAPILKDFAALAERRLEPAQAVTEGLALLYAAYDQRPRMLALLIFPPHEFTPWEVDRANPASVRSLLARMTRQDEDGEAILWGAMTGPLNDRYLRRRQGLMAPEAPSHARRLVHLVEPCARSTP